MLSAPILTNKFKTRQNRLRLFTANDVHIKSYCLRSKLNNTLIRTSRQSWSARRVEPLLYERREDEGTTVLIYQDKNAISIPSKKRLFTRVLASRCGDTIGRWSMQKVSKERATLASIKPVQRRMCIVFLAVHQDFSPSRALTEITSPCFDVLLM